MNPSTPKGLSGGTEVVPSEDPLLEMLAAEKRTAVCIGLGFWGLGFRVSGLGCRVLGFGF